MSANHNASETPHTLNVFAPAKVNLFLHITGRDERGYHELDSLIAFVDVGDEIAIRRGDGFTFEITGPFAHAFNDSDKSTSPNSTNLIIRAVWALSQLVNKTPHFEITLKKNLPLGAGLGGGSSDAAAVIWELLRYWGIPAHALDLQPLLLSLGADVPVCFECSTSHLQSIGDQFDRYENMPELHVVLIHPGKPCNTGEVFSHFDGNFSTPITMPERMHDTDEAITFLSGTHNALNYAARSLVPDIENVINALKSEDGCLLSRMSGSGSSCFGIFENIESAQEAERNIMIANPDWWVKSGHLGRPTRY